MEEPRMIVGAGMGLAAAVAMLTGGCDGPGIQFVDFRDRGPDPEQPPHYGRRTKYRRGGGKRTPPWFKGSSLAKAGARAARNLAKASDGIRKAKKRRAAIERGYGVPW